VASSCCHGAAHSRSATFSDTGFIIIRQIQLKLCKKLVCLKSYRPVLPGNNIGICDTTQLLIVTDSLVENKVADMLIYDETEILTTVLLYELLQI